MNALRLTSLLSFSCLLLSCAPKINPQTAYLAQEKPNIIPQIFAKDIISKADEYEFGSIFSKDGTEFYYAIDLDGRTEIRFSEIRKGKWTAPIVVISHKKYSYNDPFLSPDGQELYYISDQSMNGEGEPKDIDIWYSTRTKKGWSEPINAGANINSSKNEYYISFTREGKMYFASNAHTNEDNKHDFDIYTSEKINQQYRPKQKLGAAINSDAYEADVFIAPDESYLIFCANRRKVGLGRGDLYISFKDKNGNWTPSKNMGAPINSDKHELCPFVTTDGKYLFYTSNKDIYWVSTEILDQFRPTE
ncbi:MAG: hypothetical protein AAF960_03580 [Bacteroidota bacterium]